MNVLVDTSVILDVVLAREPWMADSAGVLDAASDGRIDGWVAGHTITTVHYVTAANRDRRTAAAAVVELLEIFDVVPVARTDFHRALTLELPGFEDAVQMACALRIGADFLVTRGEQGFPDLQMPTVPPGALVAMLG